METIKGSQKEILELNSTISEKLTEGFNSRSEQVKERINEFQGKTLRNYLIQEERKKGMKKSEHSLRDLWILATEQYIHYRNSRRKRERGQKTYLKKIMAENFPNMGRKYNPDPESPESSK